jgi:hypothetical protein
VSFSTVQYPLHVVGHSILNLIVIDFIETDNLTL